jgi:hypothetical protein
VNRPGSTAAADIQPPTPVFGLPVKGCDLLLRACYGRSPLLSGPIAAEVVPFGSLENAGGRDTVVYVARIVATIKLLARRHKAG